MGSTLPCTYDDSLTRVDNFKLTFAKTSSWMYQVDERQLCSISLSNFLTNIVFTNANCKYHISIITDDTFKYCFTGEIP